MKRLTLTLLVISLLFVLFFYSAALFNDMIALILLLFTALTGFVLLVLIMIASFVKKNFLAAGMGILALCIVVFRPIDFIINYIQSPIVATGFCVHTVSTASMNLRKDNSFVYNAGAFLSNENFTGTYSIKNDTVVLYFENDHPTPLMDTLIYKEHLLKEIGNPQHNHEFVLTKNLIWK